MFTIVKKNRLAGLSNEVSNLQQKVTDLHNSLETLRQRSGEMESLASDRLEDYLKVVEENKQLQERIQELEEASVYSDHNTVTFEIQDNLLSVSPIIRYNPRITEKMIELHYIDDANASSHAIQLALMVIARDAADQILESFEKPVEDA